jgi:hypothetical protein
MKGGDMKYLLFYFRFGGCNTNFRERWEKLCSDQKNPYFAGVNY